MDNNSLDLARRHLKQISNQVREMQKALPVSPEEAIKQAKSG
jgi:hypothetical protein